MISRATTNIAVFLPNWLGDVVMATPTLRAIRHHFGRQAHVVGIMRPKLDGLLAGTDWLDEQWYYDPRAGQPELRSLALVRRMRRARFDTAVLLPNSLRTAVLAWLGGARERVGYVRSARGLLLTNKLHPLREKSRFLPEPMVTYYLRLARALGCAPQSPRLELACTDQDERLADRIWEELRLRTDGRVIALNRSGAYGNAKLWPAEHFSRLAQRLVDELEHDVLVVCGPGEHPAAQEIVELAQRPRVMAMPEHLLGLSASKACIRRSRLMVSTDSGPRHIAAALGRPVVTLFGPTEPIWTANPTVRGVDLRADLDCIGCAKRVCPRGHHRCMWELTPDTVYSAVLRLLDALPHHAQVPSRVSTRRAL